VDGHTDVPAVKKGEPPSSTPSRASTSAWASVSQKRLASASVLMTCAAAWHDKKVSAFCTKAGLRGAWEGCIRKDAELRGPLPLVLKICKSELPAHLLIEPLSHPAFAQFQIGSDLLTARLPQTSHGLSPKQIGFNRQPSRDKLYRRTCRT
jgi:hypothetical protein